MHRPASRKRFDRLRRASLRALGVAGGLMASAAWAATYDLSLPFIEAMTRTRYPAELSPAVAAPTLRDLTENAGWLTDPDSYPRELAAIADWSAYPKTKSTAGWLPDRRLAFLFRAFATYDKASDRLGHDPEFVFE